MLILLGGLIVAAFAGFGNAHTVITYPGWRGNNLDINDDFPYGMQWSYPCGGLPLSTNRTNWPVTGGAISFQPGWFTGHQEATIYINLGLGTDGPDGGPVNMSFPMQPPFQIQGPTDQPYPGSICLPQVPLPEGVDVQVGDQATIQVVEMTVHGAALYNCVDITFTLPSDIEEVNETNCFNSTEITFKASSSPDTGTSTTVTSPADTTSSRRQLFSTCTPCPTFPASVSIAAPSACPTGNGNGRGTEGLGLGVPLGVLALGMLGI